MNIEKYLYFTYYRHKLMRLLLVLIFTLNREFINKWIYIDTSIGSLLQHLKHPFGYRNAFVYVSFLPLQKKGFLLSYNFNNRPVLLTVLFVDRTSTCIVILTKFALGRTVKKINNKIFYFYLIFATTLCIHLYIFITRRRRLFMLSFGSIANV